jgi:hypothetical protein
MTIIEGTTRDYVPQIDPLYKNMGRAAAVRITVDYPSPGTLPVLLIDQDMLEGYRACAGMELEILKEFENVDRENF